MSRRRSRCEAVAAHDLHQLCRSGGPPAAALITSVDSRKYCGLIAAGVIRQSAFAFWIPLLSNREFPVDSLIAPSTKSRAGQGRMHSIGDRMHYGICENVRLCVYLPRPRNMPGTVESNGLPPFHNYPIYFFRPERSNVAASNTPGNPHSYLLLSTTPTLQKSRPEVSLEVEE